MIGFDNEREQRLLSASSQLEAMKLLHDFMLHELQIAKLREEIAGQAQSEMGRQQREYLLRQQLRAIQQDLGETNPSLPQLLDIMDARWRRA